MSEHTERISYAALLANAIQALQASSASAKADAERLLNFVTGQQTAWLIAHCDEKAQPETANQYIDLVKKRQTGTPIAYLTNSQAFWNLNLTVNENVLIPRADTETLIEQALQFIDEHSVQSVLELGTGSGAIALTLVSERPHLDILATDICKHALKIAQNNAKKYHLKKIKWQQSSWFNSIKKQRFDLIVSNPPYIAPNDQHLTQGDLQFEPNIALVGSDDGLGDIRTIIASSHHYLTSGGGLLIEHGYDQARQTASILRENGFHKICTFKDLGQQPRCTLAVLK